MADDRMGESQCTSVLLDTDFGTNIDDALCLAYLLAQHGCRLLGVTTVTRHADDCVRVVGDICAAAGAAPPIAPSGSEATDLMHAVVCAHPGEVELLAVGPLTNVSLLFDRHPEVPGLLRGLTMMCGSFSRGEPGPESPERNARTDPAATTTVFAAPLPSCRSIGLNVTRRVSATADEVRAMLSCECFETVGLLAEGWFERQQRSSAVLNDPLAAVTLFDAEVCTFERGSVEIAHDEERGAGATVWRPGGPGSPHEVATDVDPGACLRHLLATFAAAQGVGKGGGKGISKGGA